MTERIEELVKSWELADQYERDDYDQLGTDVRLAVRDSLVKLPESDRKKFWDKIRSTQQNGY